MRSRRMKLPLPLAPITTSTSPAATLRSIPSSTSRSPKLLRTSSSRTTGTPGEARVTGCWSSSRADVIAAIKGNCGEEVKRDRERGGRPAPPRPPLARRRLLRPLPEALRELVLLLAAPLAGGLGGALRRVLGHGLAALEGLLARLARLLLHLVGDLSDPLVLDARRGQHEAGEEADRRCADGEADRVLLRDAAGTLNALL